MQGAKCGRLAVDVIKWADANSASILRAAIAAPTAVIVQGVISPLRCAAISRSVLEEPPTQILEPHSGENVVSFARNTWTSRGFQPMRLFTDVTDISMRGQARLDLAPCFDSRRMPRGLLGSFALNKSDSAIFVTSRGLRTGLHSDERHGMLLHVSGEKNFVVIPPDDSDGDRAVLSELLSLRGTSGTHTEIYGEHPDNLALGKVRRFQGTLQPGDALFLPQRWLHDIESITPTISVSLRFGKWDKPN